jgi:hypothetical protein
LMVMRVHQDPLDQIVSVLISGDVDQRDAWTIRVSRGDDSEVAIQKLDAADLEAFLNHLRRELINAVAVGVCQNMINDTPLVWRRTMLAQMLNTPVAELSMGDKINVGDDFLNGRTLAS